MYSPWSGKKRSKSSHTYQINVHAFNINSYLHEFFEPILFDSIFFTTMGYNPWSEKKLAVFESSNISETGEEPPTKIGVNAFHINL